MSDARDFHLVAITGNSRENAYVFAYMTATHIVVLSRLQNMTASVKERERERGREGGIEIEPPPPMRPEPLSTLSMPIGLPSVS